MSDSITLPQFILRWSARPKFESHDEGLDQLTDRLSLKSRFLKPVPFVFRQEEDVVCILGSPILNESINVQGVAQAYLGAKDRKAFCAGINGEFLLIHHNVRRETLHIVNDRFTSLPCFYVQLEDEFVLTLGYHSIWNYMQQREAVAVNEWALIEFMYLQRLMGEKTFDQKSQFLKAASYLSVSPRGFEVETYWRPDFSKRKDRSLEDWAQDLAHLLKQSMLRRTSDHKRYGLFLSGGMDTRALLAAGQTTGADFNSFTVGFRKTNEVKVAQSVAQIAQSPHTYLQLPSDYYAQYVEPLVQLSGGMYAYDHALFFGFQDQVSSQVDVLFHGHALDYLFQGMYLPVHQYKVGPHKTFIKRYDPIQGDVADAYLNRVHHRMKTVPFYRYIQQDKQNQVKEYLHQSVQAVIDAGSDCVQNSEDAWEYLMIHALSRHFTNTNVSSLMTYGEQRTAAFDVDLFDLYLSMPAEFRLSGKVLRRALQILNPALAHYEAANTGLPLDYSPWQQECAHLWRHVKRLVTQNAKHRHPQGSDRTWPYRDDYLRQNATLVKTIQMASQSNVLAEAIPLLDMSMIQQDVTHWLSQAKGGGDFMATLLTLDRFLKQGSGVAV